MRLLAVVLALSFLALVLSLHELADARAGEREARGALIEATR